MKKELEGKKLKVAPNINYWRRRGTKEINIPLFKEMIQITVKLFPENILF